MQDASSVLRYLGSCVRCIEREEEPRYVSVHIPIQLDNASSWGDAHLREPDNSPGDSLDLTVQITAVGNRGVLAISRSSHMANWTAGVVWLCAILGAEGR